MFLNPLFARVYLVVPVDREDSVCVLLYATAFPEVLQAWFTVPARGNATVQLGARPTRTQSCFLAICLRLLVILVNSSTRLLWLPSDSISCRWSTMAKPYLWCTWSACRRYRTVSRLLVSSILYVQFG